LESFKTPSPSAFAFDNQTFLKFLANPLKKLACQLKPWRKLVEAMGIEPMSAEQVTPSTTCLFFDYTHTTAAKTQHCCMRQLVILI